jgi:predicted amidohydrolase
MTICAVQLDVAWEDPARNHARVRELLAKAALEPDSLVVLPELFACGFSMNVDRVGEDHPRPTEALLREIAHMNRVYVIGGVASRTNDRVKNEAVVANPDGEVVARYAKLHPFSPGGESAAYTRGDDVVQFDCQEFRVAPFICYDLRFPEIFRRATRRGANLFAVIANWPSVRIEHWLTLLRARAIENQAYVIGVNRCGSDPNLTYPGRSIVFDPLGSVLADAQDGEKTLVAAIDVHNVSDFRAKLPFLHDIRPEFLPTDHLRTADS